MSGPALGAGRGALRKKKIISQRSRSYARARMTRNRRKLDIENPCKRVFFAYFVMDTGDASPRPHDAGGSIGAKCSNEKERRI